MLFIVVFMVAFWLWAVTYVTVAMAVLLPIIVLGPEALYVVLYAYHRVTGHTLPIRRLLQGEPEPC